MIKAKDGNVSLKGSLVDIEGDLFTIFKTYTAMAIENELYKTQEEVKQNLHEIVDDSFTSPGDLFKRLFDDMYANAKKTAETEKVEELDDIASDIENDDVLSESQKNTLLSIVESIRKLEEATKK